MTGREVRSPELDTMAEVFAVAGEKQETVADQETLVLRKRLSRNPDIEKARAESELLIKPSGEFQDFDSARLL